MRTLVLTTPALNVLGVDNIKNTLRCVFSSCLFQSIFPELGTPCHAGSPLAVGTGGGAPSVPGPPRGGPGSTPFRLEGLARLCSALLNHPATFTQGCRCSEAICTALATLLCAERLRLPSWVLQHSQCLSGAGDAGKASPFNPNSGPSRKLQGMTCFSGDPFKLIASVCSSDPVRPAGGW